MAIPQANNPTDFHKAKLLAIGHFFIMSLPKKIGLDEGREACRKSKSTHQNDIEVVRIKKGTERPGRRSTRPRCKIENKVREGGKQKFVNAQMKVLEPKRKGYTKKILAKHNEQVH